MEVKVTPIRCFDVGLGHKRAKSLYTTECLRLLTFVAEYRKKYQQIGNRNHPVLINIARAT
jgi:hypothetical protein